MKYKKVLVFALLFLFPTFVYAKPISTVVNNGNNINILDGNFSCTFYLGDPTDPNDTAYYLQTAFNVMKYIAIILLLVFVVVDYFKAIVSQDSDAIKKATQTAAKRLIIAIAVFFLPTLIKYVLTFLNMYGTYDVCGIK